MQQFYALFYWQKIIEILLSGIVLTNWWKRMNEHMVAHAAYDTVMWAILIQYYEMNVPVQI